MEAPVKKSKGHHCYFCGQRFPDKNILRKHISIHKDREHFCEVCGKAFSTRWGRNKHMRGHTGERPYLCEMCGKSFIQKTTMQKHVKSVHSSNSTSRCKTCGRGLKSNPSAQCWLCRYEGRVVTEIMADSEVTEENNFEVYIANDIKNFGVIEDESENSSKSMVNISDIAEEFTSDDMKTVNGDIKIINLPSSPDSRRKMFCCELCNNIFPTLISLQEHQLNHGFDDPFTCTYCGSRFKTSKSLKNHLVSHVELRPHICEKCGKDFKRRDHLNKHMVTHTDDRPYVCKICESAFKTMLSLKQHGFSHMDDRPYVCKDCGRRFKNPYLLKSHVLNHSRPLKCQTCGKVFNCLANLQRHVRMHTGEKPYQCRMCDKCFTHTNGRRIHEISQHKDAVQSEQFKCVVCGRKFRSISNFKKHMSLHTQSSSILGFRAKS